MQYIKYILNIYWIYINKTKFKYEVIYTHAIEFIRPKSRFGSIKRKLGEREAETPTLQPKGNEALYLHRQVEC